MSYNCDQWIVKEIESLKVPISSLFKHGRSDWHPKRVELGDGRTRFEVFNRECALTGIVNGDLLEVDHIDCHGEGSGTSLNWIIEPALEESTGRLVVSTVWEGGDYIARFSVVDGIVEWEEIEI